MDLTVNTSPKSSAKPSNDDMKTATKPTSAYPPTFKTISAAHEKKSTVTTTVTTSTTRKHHENNKGTSKGNFIVTSSAKNENTASIKYDSETVELESTTFEATAEGIKPFLL